MEIKKDLKFDSCDMYVKSKGLMFLWAECTFRQEYCIFQKYNQRKEKEKRNAKKDFKLLEKSKKRLNCEKRREREEPQKRRKDREG